MTETSFTLSWETPESDGGGPIIEYEVEIKETTSKKWRVCGKSNGSETHIFVDKLVLDMGYDFKIFARNEAGLSPPLLTDDEKIVCGRRISKLLIRFLEMFQYSSRKQKLFKHIKITIKCRINNTFALHAFLMDSSEEG